MAGRGISRNSGNQEGEDMELRKRTRKPGFAAKKRKRRKMGMLDGPKEETRKKREKSGSQEKQTNQELCPATSFFSASSAFPPFPSAWNRNPPARK